MTAEVKSAEPESSTKAVGAAAASTIESFPDGSTTLPLSSIQVDRLAPNSDSNADNHKDDEAATEGTDGSVGGDDADKADTAATTTAKQIIVSVSKKSRPPYKYDPNKITLRFLFANRDGLTVTIECDPSDTVAKPRARSFPCGPKTYQTARARIEYAWSAWARAI